MAKTNNTAGAASKPGAANNASGTGSFADPSIPASNAYRPCDGAVIALPFSDMRVTGSAPAQDTRDPQGPKSG